MKLTADNRSHSRFRVLITDQDYQLPSEDSKSGVPGLSLNDIMDEYGFKREHSLREEADGYLVYSRPDEMNPENPLLSPVEEALYAIEISLGHDGYIVKVDRP